jgi:hypothetical protein
MGIVTSNWGFGKGWDKGMFLTKNTKEEKITKRGRRLNNILCVLCKLCASA